MITADLVIENAIVVTVDADRRVLSNGLIAIKSGRIIAVVNCEKTSCSYDAKQVIDGKGKVVLPGLIDCHGHAGHSLLRTLGTATPAGWPTACEMLYSKGSTEEFWEIDAYLMSLERLKFGTTCGMTLFGGGGAVLTGDMVMRLDSPVYAERHFDAVGQVGVREFLAIGPRRSPFPHEFVHRESNGNKHVKVGLEDYLKNSETLIAAWHGGKNGRIRTAITTQTYHPRLAEVGSPRHGELKDEIRIFYELAQSHDLLFTQDGHAGGTIAFAQNELDILGPQTLLSHSTDLMPEDIEACVTSGTHIVHNPSAIASVTGRCPVPELIDAGVNVVIASDGAGPDRSADLFRHMFYAMRYHRRHFRDPAVLPAGKALEMVTIDAAKALGVEKDLGSLEVGKKADLILIDTNQPHLSPMLMPVEQIVNFASGHDVEMVMVDGEVLVEGRVVTSVDEERILSRVQDIAEEAIEYSNLQDLLKSGSNLWGRSGLA